MEGHRSNRRLQEDREVCHGILDRIRVQEFSQTASLDERESREIDDLLGLLRRRAIEPAPRPLAEECKISITMGQEIGFSSHCVPAVGHRFHRTPKPQVEHKRRKELRTRPNFAIPTTGGERPTTEDGHTSFHFKHDSVTKTRIDTVNGSGQRNRPGAAAAHQQYLERDGAVARFEAIFGTPEQEATKLAELAEKHGIVINVDRSQSNSRNQEDTYDNSTTRPEFNGHISLAAVAVYQSDLATNARRTAPGSVGGMLHLSSGLVVSHTWRGHLSLWGDERNNVDHQVTDDHRLRRPGAGVGEITVRPASLERNTPAGVAAEHSLYIERPEAQAVLHDGVPILFTNIPGSTQDRAELWRLIETFERDPSKDKVHIDLVKFPEFWRKIASDPSCPVELQNALATAPERQILKIEVDDGTYIRQWLWRQDGCDKTNPPAKFKDARGGRIQYRINGELPNELTINQRAAILNEFCEVFREKKLPFCAVMHQPDHNNDERNWHFHLDYYDRPVSKINGAWDFTLQEKEGSKNNPNRLRSCEQLKDPEIIKKHWIPKLRKIFCDISNRHLEIAGAARRLDHRKFSEMGIDREPQSHLGTKSSAIEAVGVPTTVGAANADKEWSSVFRKIARTRAKADAAAEKQTTAWSRQVVSNLKGANHIDHLTRAIADWRQIKDEANEYKEMADTVNAYRSRTTSRAARTLEKCKRNLAAIAAGKASSSLVKNLHKIEGLKQAALEYIAHCDAVIGTGLEMAKQWTATHHALEAQAIASAKQVSRSLDVALFENAFPDRTSEQAASPAVTKAAIKTVTPVPASRSNTALADFVPSLENSRHRHVISGDAIAPKLLLPENEATVSRPDLRTIDPQPAAVNHDQDTLQAPSPAMNPRVDLNRVFMLIASAPVRICDSQWMLQADPSLHIPGDARKSLQSAPAQQRLRGIKKVQDEQFARLERYATSHPEGVSIANGQIVLGADAPDDVIAIVAKWSRDKKQIIDVEKCLETRRIDLAQAAAVTSSYPATSPTMSEVASAGTPDLPTSASRRNEAADNRKDKLGDNKIASAAELPARNLTSRPVPSAVDQAVIGQIATGRPDTEWGIHANIDAWLKALNEGKSDAVRCKLAATVTTDRASRDLLANINPGTANRIAGDAKKHFNLQAQFRQQGLGL